VNKPNGQFKIESNLEEITGFINNFPVRKIKGIGPSTGLILDCYGIKTCEDINKKRAMLYYTESARSFKFLMEVSKGIGCSEIVHDGERLSIGHET
jgi:nucleotidyltransferase/DNA polymerase involved in DNA repair